MKVGKFGMTQIPLTITILSAKTAGRWRILIAISWEQSKFVTCPAILRLNFMKLLYGGFVQCAQKPIPSSNNAGSI